MKNSELLLCLQCGTCTGSCPSGIYTSLNVRRIIRDSVRKDVSNDSELWMCTTCYNCQERCPRGIRIADAILELRSEAVRKGIMLPAHKRVARFLIETGHATPLDEPHKAARKKMGLGLPETTHKYPEALKEVQTLLKSTRFYELIK